ncbi:putative CheW-like signal transduction protein [Nitrospira japonica]|uniref:Putative CheW-like signal transduction protein n=1 Tax=Nitrospira japonica TaxID=1325564 RepID=A0A1W1I9Y3_9BACT|nr:chemotaxis protein CheW [Nitrospira japonica]SLM49689.1 putative CheW-like signal transduction protein [Nitrospira japonica]
MLRAARQQERAVATRQSWSIVVFSVGGMKLAAKAEDVGGISAWGSDVPVPSRTPFVGSLVKRDKDVLPVYDLAARLNRQRETESTLCLVTRHAEGPMAICIDAEIPSLHTVDASEVRPSRRNDIETIGSFVRDGLDIDIVALRRLGQS